MPNDSDNNVLAFDRFKVLVLNDKTIPEEVKKVLGVESKTTFPEVKELRHLFEARDAQAK